MIADATFEGWLETDPNAPTLSFGEPSAVSCTSSALES